MFKIKRPRFNLNLTLMDGINLISWYFTKKNIGVEILGIENSPSCLLGFYLSRKGGGLHPCRNDLDIYLLFFEIEISF